MKRGLMNTIRRETVIHISHKTNAYCCFIFIYIRAQWLCWD